jgi:hypothetical protein
VRSLLRIAAILFLLLLLLLLLVSLRVLRVLRVFGVFGVFGTPDPTRERQLGNFCQSRLFRFIGSGILI